MKAYSGELDLWEERWNTVTHILGILFGLVSIPILIMNACDRASFGVITGTSVYGLSFLMVFTSSTLFHYQKEGKKRHLFKIWDHISIYFLIAGTYTPFILIFVNNNFGMTLLCVLWGLTVVGTIFKTFFTGRFEIVSTIIYLLMGWMLLAGVNEFFANMPYHIVFLIVAGGVLYSVGVIFYLWRCFTLHHAVWHLFVLAAAICHYSAVLMAVSHC
ncbi:MAG TPA: hemolysin III family protein [Chitinophagaceae bacterium]|nr:hemolysin III family protein [Chitinophagaceae bacterium]